MTDETVAEAVAGVIDDAAGDAISKKRDELLALIPEAQRPAAAALLAEYGPALFKMAVADAWQAIRRLQAGDLDVACELDAKLSGEAWIAKVKQNTARWESVANYNITRAKLRQEFALRVAPVILSVLLALVGL